MSSTVVTVRLPEELGNQLTDLANRTHRTRAFYVREAVVTHLEDVYDYYEAAEIARQVATGEMPVISWNDLLEEYDVDSEPTSDDHLRFLTATTCLG